VSGVEHRPVDDEGLVDRFERAAIASGDWTHEAHVRVVQSVLRRRGLEGAVAFMAEGIPRLNAAHGTPETPTRGYHHTLTCVWTCLVADALGVLDGGPPNARDADALLERRPDLLDRRRPLAHYTCDRLASLEARRGLVTPDRSPVPGLERLRVARRATDASGG